MEPAFAQFEQQYEKKLRIVKVNVDDRTLYAEYAQYKGSSYIPETVVVKDGKVLFQKTGAMSLAALQDAVADASR